MRQSNIIPEFKKKELNLDYLTELFDDDTRSHFKRLWQTFADFDVILELSQIMALMDYSTKSGYYASQLMSLLKGEDFREYLPSQMEEFRDSFCPESKAEQLIFNIFRDVCDEIYWADDILRMNEFKSLSGDE